MIPGKIPEQFEDISLFRKASVYHDGQVTSYNVLFKDGKRKRVGVMCPGVYKFKTDDLDRMDMTAVTFPVRQANEGQLVTYQAGDALVVPGWSYFEISEDNGVAKYVSSLESHLDKKTYVA